MHHRSADNFTDDITKTSVTTTTISHIPSGGGHEEISTALLALFMVGITVGFLTITSLVMIFVVLKRCYIHEDVRNTKSNMAQTNNSDKPPSYDEIITISLQNEFPPTYKEAKKLAKSKSK